MAPKISKRSKNKQGSKTNESTVTGKSVARNAASNAKREKRLSKKKAEREKQKQKREKISAKLEENKRAHLEQQKKLEEAPEDAELKKIVENLVAELAKLKEQQDGYDAELMDLDEEIKDYEDDLMQVDSDDGDGGDELLVTGAGTAATGAETAVTGAGTVENGSNQETRKEANVKKEPSDENGLHDKEVGELLVTQGSRSDPDGLGDVMERKEMYWKRSGGGKQIVIVRYGPPNAPAYRIERVSGMEHQTAVPNKSDVDDRRGEKATKIKKTGEKKWDFNKGDLLGITGVALPVDTKHKNLLDIVDPTKKMAAKPGGIKRFQPVEPQVKWKLPWTDSLGDTSDKSGETRGAFERVWDERDKNKTALAIFEAAKIQEERHQRWKNGQLKARGRSVTVDPDLMRTRGKSALPSTEGTGEATVSQPKTSSQLAKSNEENASSEGDTTGEGDRSSEEGTSSQARTTPSKSSTKGKEKETGKQYTDEELKEELAKYRRGWCLANDKDVKNLNAQDKADFFYVVKDKFPQLVQ